MELYKMILGLSVTEQILSIFLGDSEDNACDSNASVQMQEI